MNHEAYMKQAIQVARANPAAPFGTVLVDRGTDQVVATGINQSGQNPVLHGEMVALHRYAESGAGNWNELTLFTTAEPCCMCQAAIIWAGIPQVVFGTSIRTLQNLGWKQFQLTASDVVESAEFFDCRITSGCLEDECNQLFRAKP